MAVMEPSSIYIEPDIYAAIERTAKHRNQSVDTLVNEGLRQIFDVPSVKAGTVDEAYLDSMETFSDEQLWAIVETRLSAEENQRKDYLLERNGEEILSAREKTELAKIVDLVNDQMLFRSKALSILHQRGHDIHTYLANVNVE